MFFHLTKGFASDLAYTTSFKTCSSLIVEGKGKLNRYNQNLNTFFCLDFDNCPNLLTDKVLLTLPFAKIISCQLTRCPLCSKFAGVKKTRKKKGLESQLRQAILQADMSRNKLSQISGVDPAQLCYFVQGKRSLTLRSAERIAEALGLELRPTRKKKGR